MAAFSLAQSILGFVAIVACGALLRASGLVSREDARPLNAVIVYVGLPAFVFRAVHGASITTDALVVIAVAWVVFAVVFSVAMLAARLLRLPGPRAGGFVLASSLGNTGYLGYPLTAALLGAAAVPVAVFYDVFGTVLQLVVVGFPLARRLGGGERLGYRQLLKELVTFPALIAAIVALAASRVPVPNPVSDWLGLLASMVAPLIMLSVGIALKPRTIAHGAVALAGVVAIRLVLAPLLVGAFGHAVIADEAVFRTALLEAGMPTMMLTLPIGERFGLDADFIASAVFVTTALSAITLPLAQALVT